MSTGIGIYPGGPHGAASGREIHEPVHLPRVEEIEECIERRSKRHRRRNRRKRVIVALLLGTLLAGGLGLIVGRSAHTTPEELVKELEAQGNPNAGIANEIDRVLLELWRMEEVESARTRGGR